MKKVELLNDRCFGCGACCNIASDNFTFSDDGRTVLISDKVTDEAIEASEMCPASAIIIKDSKCSCSKNGCECTDGECNCDDSCDCGCKD